MFGRKDITLTARVAPDTDSGKYAIAELAFIQTVDDTEYVTSAGVAVRKDDMPKDVKAVREEARKARKKADAES